MTSDPRFRDTEPLSRLSEPVHRSAPGTFQSDHFYIVRGDEQPSYVPRHRVPAPARRPWWKRLLRRPR